MANRSPNLFSLILVNEVFTRPRLPTEIQLIQTVALKVSV
jgi:hypothetical protein